MDRAKLTIAANKRGKNFKAKMLEAILEQLMYVLECITTVDSLRTRNKHVWVLKNSGYNLISLSSQKLDWTHTFGTYCILVNISPHYRYVAVPSDFRS